MHTPTDHDPALDEHAAHVAQLRHRAEQLDATRSPHRRDVAAALAAARRTVDLLAAQVDAEQRDDTLAAQLLARAQIEAWLIAMYLALHSDTALTHITAATAEAHLRNRNDTLETNQLVRRARKWLRSRRQAARRRGLDTVDDAVAALLAAMADATSRPSPAPTSHVPAADPRPLNMSKVRDAVAKGLSRRQLDQAGVTFNGATPPTVDFTAHRAYDRYRALCGATHTNLDTLTDSISAAGGSGVDSAAAVTEAALALDLLDEVLAADHATTASHQQAG